jgi:hypothetical protein
MISTHLPVAFVQLDVNRGLEISVGLIVQINLSRSCGRGSDISPVAIDPRCLAGDSGGCRSLFRRPSESGPGSSRGHFQRWTTQGKLTSTVTWRIEASEKVVHLNTHRPCLAFQAPLTGLRGMLDESRFSSKQGIRAIGERKPFVRNQRSFSEVQRIEYNFMSLLPRPYRNRRHGGH